MSRPILSTPTRLRVEHLDDAFGIDVQAPRLSWRLPEGAKSQIAYQLRAGDWDSGRINSDQSMLVEYARRTGWFGCSDERINKLHEAAVWTLKGNVIDIPTECPHRERSGWTSEWQNFVRSAAFLYDVAGFSTKWLRDLAIDQKPDGAFYHCAPEIKYGKSEVVLPAGSAGYSDAGPGGVIKPATQANYVRALAFGLAPGDLRDLVARNLVDLIREVGTHVGTGTFGTAYLLPVLADMGYSNLAYELLLQNTPCRGSQ